MGLIECERPDVQGVSWINKWPPEKRCRSFVAKALTRIGLSAPKPESERPFSTSIPVHQLHTIEDGRLRRVLLAQAAGRRGSEAEIIFPVVLMPEGTLDHSVAVVSESYSIGAAIKAERSSASPHE